MTQQANLILGLIAQTSIHAGAGSSVGAIDLPIQREGHNGWPCVFGSAVKGALRAKAARVLTNEEGQQDQETLFAVFGPDTTGASEHAGAISVGDARLLLLPVRSLTSAFKWVTCPAALERLKRDADMLGKPYDFPVPKVNGEASAKWPQGKASLFLEEFRFNAEQEDLSAVIAAIAGLVNREDFASALAQHLVVVSDDMFAFIARHATPVNAHIALKSDTKTVAKGALWYEETLPPETVLYVPIMAQRSRREDKDRRADNVVGAQAVAHFIGEALFDGGPWLQLGGNETVGMGWCAVKSVRMGG